MEEREEEEQSHSEIDPEESNWLEWVADGRHQSVLSEMEHVTMRTRKIVASAANLSSEDDSPGKKTCEESGRVPPVSSAGGGGVSIVV